MSLQVHISKLIVETALFSFLIEGGVLKSSNMGCNTSKLPLANTPVASSVASAVSSLAQDTKSADPLTNKSNNLMTNLAEKTNKSNDLITNLAEKTTKASDHMTNLAEKTNKSNDLMTNLAEKTNKSNDFMTNLAEKTNKSNDLMTNLTEKTTKASDLMTNMADKANKSNDLLKLSSEDPQNILKSAMKNVIMKENVLNRMGNYYHLIKCYMFYI